MFRVTNDRDLETFNDVYVLENLNSDKLLEYFNWIENRKQIPVVYRDMTEMTGKVNELEHTKTHAYAEAFQGSRTGQSCQEALSSFDYNTVLLQGKQV